MKKILTICIIALLVACGADGQAINVNINVGDQPAWGPTGYDRVNYYYLPDIDVFYDVPNRVFVYAENNRWVTKAELPPRYKNYDLFSGYKVVVNEPKPYLKVNYYRTTYARYKNYHGTKQPVIRDTKDEKYRAARERWDRDHKNNRNNDRKGHRG